MVRLFGILAALARERLVHYIGLVVPIAIGLLGLTTALSFSAVAAVGLASVIGDFFVKYTIAKAGIYLPLRPQVTRAIR